MERHVVGSRWDRENRNGTNNNFSYIFESLKNFKTDIMSNFDEYIPRGGISVEMTNFISASKNIFDPSNLTEGRVSIDGEIATVESVYTTDYSIIKPLTTYVANIGCWLATYDSTLNFVHYQYLAGGDSFTTKSNSRAIRISVSEVNIGRFQMEEGNTPTSFEPHGITFTGLNIKELTEARFSTTKDLMFPSISARIDEVERASASNGGANLGSDTQAEQAFVDEMNAKAVSLGFNRPNFKNSSGLSAAGQVTVTKDMLLLLRGAMNTPELLNIWGRKNYTAEVKGVNPRSVTVETTVKNSTFEQEYTILGGKTGTLGIVHNLSVVARHKETGKIVAGNVLRSNADRWVSMKVALDNAVNGTNTVVDAYAASSFIVENNSPLTIFESLQPSYIFGEASLQSPASITKILSAIIAIEGADNLNQPVVFKETDHVEDVLVMQTGDVLTLRDALHLMMLQSNNSTAKAVGRTIGHYIINSRGYV